MFEVLGDMPTRLYGRAMSGKRTNSHHPAARRRLARSGKALHASVKSEVLGDSGEVRYGRAVAKKTTSLREPMTARQLPRWVQWVSLLVVVLAAGAALLVSIDFDEGSGRTYRAPKLPKHVDKMTADDLAALTDAQLEAMDPLVVDLIVARGIPGLETLDIAKYATVVDDWARRIDAANRAAERFCKNEPTYKVSREFWMAGGMAVMLANPAFGISYTTEHLDNAKPEQQFVHGLIDKKTGTCATMPVLYMAIGHRLGWPIHAVVSRDHMWARWDDGVGREKGGQRFNLEATNAKSNGKEGSFASLTDAEYAEWLETPRSAIESGSDFTTLTARQALGVFLQGRAAYWVTRENLNRAESDLDLAVKCFPQNVDIRRFWTKVKVPTEMRVYARRLRGFNPDPQSMRSAQYLDVDRINRTNREALERWMQPPQPVDTGFPLASWP